jgi:hypothetical protein
MGGVEQVTGLSDLSWKLRIIRTGNGDEALLATSSSGIFQVEGGKATLVKWATPFLQPSSIEVIPKNNLRWIYRIVG